jgi:hypothetical protein
VELGALNLEPSHHHSFPANKVMKVENVKTMCLRFIFLNTSTKILNKKKAMGIKKIILKAFVAFSLVLLIKPVRGGKLSNVSYKKREIRREIRF